MKDESLLRILFVEDMPSDAELAKREIRKSGLNFNSERVDTKEGLLKALKEFKPDLIVSDYMMPTFNGMEALQLSLELDSTIPVIILTGSMNEETAVECLKAGAANYVLKENIERLPLAVTKAIEDKRVLRARDAAEFALRESEEQYRDLVEHSRDLLCTHSLDGKLLSVNEAAVRLTGYSRDALLQMNMVDLIVPGVRRLFGAYLKRIGANGQAKGIMQIQTANSETRYWEYDNTLRVEGVAAPLVRGMAHDITERIRSEQAMRDSEERYRSLFMFSPEALYVHVNGHVVLVNPSLCRLLGADNPSKLIGKSVFDIVHPADHAKVRARMKDVLTVQFAPLLDEKFVRLDGTTVDVEVTAVAIDWEGSRAVQVIARDVTERKRAEEALRTSESQLSSAVTMAHLGHWEYEVATDQFRFNDHFYALFRTTAEQVGGYTMSSADYAHRFVYPEDMPKVGAEIRKTLETTDPQYNGQLEHRIIYADGQIGWITVRIFIIKDKRGVTIKTYGVNQDITERKQMEEAILYEQSLLRSILDNVPDHVYFKDKESHFLKISRSQSDVFGLTDPAQAAGKTDSDFFSLEHSKQALKDEQNIIRSGIAIFDVEEKETWPDGRETWVSTTKMPLQNAQGQIMGTFGVSRDITERKHSHEVLRENEEFFRLLFTASPDAIILFDPNSTRVPWEIVDCNEVACRMNGYTREELIGKSVNMLNTTTATREERDAYRKLVEEKGINCFETVHRHHDGHIFPIEVAAAIVVRGGRQLLLGIDRDITERKNAESAMREREDRYRMLFENNPLPMWVYDPKTLAFRTVNDSAIEQYGYAREEFLSMTLADIRPKEDLARLSADVSRQRPTIQHSGEWRHRLKNGTIIDVEITSHSFRDGDHDAVLVVANDVTERKLAELALHESEDRYRLLVETLPDGVIVHRQGRVVFANYASAGIIGADSPADLVGRSVIDFVHPDFRAIVMDRIQRSLSEGVHLPVAEERFVRMDGTTVDVEVSAVPISYAGKPAMLTVVNDITERKKIEESIRESEELFRMVFENVSDGISIYAEDPNPLKRRLVECNVRYAAMSGRSREELLKIGFTRSLQLPPVGTSAINSSWSNESKAVLHGSFSWIRPDGKENHIEYAGVPVIWKGKTHTIGIDHDITESKNAEEALRKSEERYRGMFENVQDVYYESSLDGTILELSPSIAMLSKGQYHREELIGKSMNDFYVEPKQRDALLAAVQARGRVTDFEIMLRNRDGSVFACSVSASIHNDKRGGAQKIIGSLRDVTERKKAKETQLLLTTALESAANGVLITDIKGNIEWLNKAFTAMTGFTGEDVIGKNPRILKSGKQDPLFYKNLWETISAGNVWQGEMVNSKKDGSLFTDETTITPLMNKNGAITNFIAIKQDITRRKKIETEISMLGQAIKSISECVSITDLDDIVIYVNEAFLKMYGYEEGEIIGKDIKIVRSRNNKMEKVRDILAQTVGGSWHGELMNVRKNGSEFPVFLSTSVVSNDEGKAIALIGVAVDITGRKQAEETLKDSEERLRILFEYAPDAYYLNDLKGIFVDGNKAAEELTGYQRKELIGNNMLSLGLLQPNQVIKVASLLAQSVFGRPTGPDELHLKRKDGSEITAEIRTYPIKVKDKTLVLGIARDITKRKHAEEETQKNRKLLDSIFETSRDGMVLEDEHGMITFVNTAFVKLYKYTSENELVGKHVSIIQSPEDNERMLEYGRKRLKGEEVPSIYEFKGKCKDGSLVDFEVSVAVTDIGGKKHILSIVRDIRDRKKGEFERQGLEDRIRQAQKMEAIGTLAGGIAHDFNNILGIILGHLSIVTHPDYDQALRTSSAETITNAVRRGANLVRQILTFARKSDPKLLPVNVNESVREIHKMLEETFPKSIDFVLELEKTLPFVVIDGGQLHQALLNLCVNARDAIADVQVDREMESRITLKTALVLGKDLRGHFPEVSAEQYVAIAVSDTGTGMDENTRKRIFEPFFTTKEKGKGTGLGLAVVYGVVSSVRGIVDVQSTPGKGSVFTLYLPVPKETSVTEPMLEKPQSDIRGGTETLLIIEDEASLLSVLKMRLEKKGYAIISAIDGHDALEKFQEHKDRINLVITDLGLPKMSGEHVLVELKKMKPDIKVIVASGFIGLDQRAELLALGANEIIMKPYEQTEVQEKVRDVLDGRARPEPTHPER